MKKNLEEASKSDFLLKLKKSLETGNPEIAKDSIEKINEIHKLADTMSGDVAQTSLDKRIEDAGEKEALTSKERELISLESEKQKIKLLAEEEKLILISQIENGKHDLELTREEFEHVKEQYTQMLQAQEEELKVLNIKYEAKYDEKYGE